MKTPPCLFLPALIAALLLTSCGPNKPEDRASNSEVGSQQGGGVPGPGKPPQSPGAKPAGS